MKKILVALGVAGVLVFTGAASCQDRQPTEFYEYPDCDADDRSPNWEVADCGPSPKPMLTAYQPKPKTSPRKPK